MRGDQLSRQWRILKRIEAGKLGITPVQIAKSESVSVRTVYRDLYDLQTAGFPLYSEKGENGQYWKFIESYSLELHRSFSFMELLSLYLSKDLFKVFEGTLFYESIISLFEKIKRTMPYQTIEYLKRVETSFNAGVKFCKDYGRFREVINQLYQAIIERRSVEMVYRPLRANSDTVRKVNPFRMRFYDGTIYVIGLCRLRNEIRTFIPDRIKMIKLLNERFDMPKDFDLNGYMCHSFGVMQDELYQVKIRVVPEWTKYMGERKWHDSQEVKILSDGSMEMTFRVAGLTEICQWIMGFGANVKVLKPKALTQMIKHNLHAALAQYGDTAIKPSKTPAKSAGGSG